MKSDKYMSDISPSGSQLILSSGYRTGDLESGKFAVQNGSVFVYGVVGGTDSGGTIRPLAVDSSGRINANVTASGTTTGTMNVGTINAGTINTGTINVGTFRMDRVPTVIGTSYAIQGTTGTGFWGTVVGAAGAGTRQYVTGVDIFGVSGTVDVAVTNAGITGSTGAGVLARGNFSPGLILVKDFAPAQASNTNGTIAYWMGGAGTVNIVVQFWQQ